MGELTHIYMGEVAHTGGKSVPSVLAELDCPEFKKVKGA